ncbi:ABC transporter permease [Fulvitalea axinellae]|uniref:ABC transporter permease n=1 Tax=Fulvitalea axinellae TaxID=1182444 RepID=A0AAU9CZ46_9BACT|nr:ABC transporter permease [Fulvitalea axinellae]
MFDWDKWQEILFTIRKNKLRSFLTAFSVSWGVFMLILLLGAGSGLRNGVESQFRDDAINSLWISPGQTSIPYKGSKPGRSIRMTNEDYEVLSSTIEGVEKITARYNIWGEFTVRYKDKYSAFDIRSCHPDHRYLEKTIMTGGRFLNQLDIDEKRKVCVIGSQVKSILFDDGTDPLGEWIDVKGIPYRIVGTYEDNGNERETRIIYIPISTAQTAYGGGNRIHRLMLTMGDASLEESKVIEEKVRATLSERHQYSPEDDRAMYINNGVEDYERFSNIFKGIDMLMWFIGFFTILAGIVGVSNIMMIVVKERTREIGVRKALGAPPRSIVGLFISEAVLITFIAGFVGMFLGVLLVDAIGSAGIDFEFFKSPQANIKVAVGASIILIVAGAIAGWIPARKASQISPIEALKDE